MQANHKPEEDELLEEYLIAVDLLTINNEFRLRKRVEKLEIEKSEMDNLALRLKKLEAKIK